MLLELDNWNLGYSQILDDCRHGKALILCNADVDALASARILTYMLRNDAISYQLLPCRTYSQLQKRMQANSDAAAVILLNLGATRNLTPFLQTEDQKIYVMDCRRPFHLANIHADMSIVVFGENKMQLEEIPSDGDNLSGDDSTTSEEDASDDDESDSDSSDDEGENEFEGGEENSILGDSINQDTPLDDSSMNEEVGIEQEPEYDGEDEKEDGGSKGTKAKDSVTMDKLHIEDLSVTMALTESTAAETPTSTHELAHMTPRNQYLQRREHIREYYKSGNYYGTPAAFISYRLATQFRYKERGDLLWLACVGVTDAYLHARLGYSGYSMLAMELRDTCHQLFPSDDWTVARNNVYAEQLRGNEDQTHDGGGSMLQKRTKIAFSKNGQVKVDDDFRFFLLRHSSLYDAMVLSDYVSTKFQVSTVAGKHRLQEMLAKMGLPLEECHQPYVYLKPSLRRQLRAKFEEYADEYDLQHMIFTSFFRVVGYQSLLSAADTSYAVTALLESEDSDQDQSKSFNTALDALNSSQSSLVNGSNLTGDLGQGIHLAQYFQRKVVQTATSLVERKEVTRLSHFRYVYVNCSSESMEETSSAQSHLFAKPLALTRLAHYLMDWYRESGRWKAKPLPLVILAEKPPESYVVVGYEYPETTDDDSTKNRFGKKFVATSQSMQGTCRFDSFDCNVVEVARSDAQRFLEQLHYLLELEQS